ncbi:MAG: hypothetical protein HN855_13765 [Anaerolineae bacterium]|jgi:hypothetical protein|nr:hypothetical protein [Anaerolineae bacterium]MBT7070593.1 hypothetical protein [Anaerolineae bacterium]MBT7326223.1 hypothetical protein [Anaerolineae bacterium]
MPPITTNSFRKNFLVGIIGGVVGAVLGGALGFFTARANDPTGWSEIPNLLTGSIYGYGLGVGLGLFILHRHPHAPSAFSRAFLGALTGLFAVIFLSAPLRLDIFPPLMWGALILLPPLIAARLLTNAKSD